MIRVRRATPDEVIDLRHQVLRAGLARETAVFEGDEAQGTVHVVAVDAPDAGGKGTDGGGRIVGCATMLLSQWDGRPAWQVRGMAVAPELQRSGVGGQMLQALQRIASNDPAGLRTMWCNARTPAVGFYRRHGWAVASEEFVIPLAGPHVKMTLKLEPSDVR